MAYSNYFGLDLILSGRYWMFKIIFFLYDLNAFPMLYSILHSPFCSSSQPPYIVHFSSPIKLFTISLLNNPCRINHDQMIIPFLQTFQSVDYTDDRVHIFGKVGWSCLSHDRIGLLVRRVCWFVEDKEYRDGWRGGFLRKLLVLF